MKETLRAGKKETLERGKVQENDDVIIEYSTKYHSETATIISLR